MDRTYLLKYRYDLLFTKYIFFAFLSLWVKRNFSRMRSFRLEMSDWFFCSNNLFSLNTGLNDCLAIDLMALLFAVWPWPVSSLRAYLPFFLSECALATAFVCNYTRVPLRTICRMERYKDGDLWTYYCFQYWSHRHGWADKVKCFYVFDRRGVRV